MTLEEFEAALDLHGPSVASWPEPLRLAAASVLGRSTEARTMLAAAAEVATLLASTRAGPTTGLDHIIAVATAQPQQRPPGLTLRLPRAGWRYAACVAVTLTGFVLGVADGLRHAPFEPIIILAFGPTDPFDAF